MSIFNRKTVDALFEEAGLEIPKDIKSKLFDLHTDSQTSLIEEINSTKSKLSEVSNDFEIFKSKSTSNESEEISKIKAEFETYKNNVESENKMKFINSEILKELKKANFNENVIDLVARDDVFKKVDLDENKKIVGLDEAINSVVSSRGNLITSIDKKDGLQVRGSTSSEPVTKLKLENLKGMSPEAINAAWDNGQIDLKGDC